MRQILTKLSFVKLVGSLTFLSFTGLYAQTENVAGTENDRNAIEKHLNDVKIKMQDTSLKELIIPKSNPIPPANYKDSSNYNQKTTLLNSHFPYPIIMVHGLASNSDTWLSLYNYLIARGWTYGGRLDFCLNSDYDNTVANLTTDITDFTGTNLSQGDFYIVNFDVNPDGSTFNNSVLSNQAAIYKQGVAMKSIVNHVLAASGKDKVIILGHSMGGLATRQYLQNSNLWQSSGQHHIAKIATLGTPHGGSNMDGTFLLNWLFPPDVQSDAVRDLRRTYFYSGNYGVFLYGGIEDDDYMWDMLFSDFYNNDVNCNGIHGETVIGLNQKSIPTNLDYSCLYGDYALALTPGDGVVSIYDSQLKNFYPTLSAETFSCTDNHIQLTSLIKEEFLSLDEPDEFYLSYFVNKDTIYNGYITTQAPDCPYVIDYDQYHFYVQQPGNIKVSLGNMRVTPFSIKIFDANFNLLLSQTFTSLTGTTSTIPVLPGKHYMQLYAMPNDTSWKYPYNFKIEFSPANPTYISQNIVNDGKITVFPNPTNDQLAIRLTDIKEENSVNIIITNIIGEIIYQTNIKPDNIDYFIDLSNQPEGVYFVHVLGNKNRYITKVVRTN